MVGYSAQPAAAATCADYNTQAEAQRAADTIDADGDGIYCESLPCPCLRPGDPAPTPVPPAPPATEPGPADERIRARVASVTDGDTLNVQTLTGRRLTVRLVGIDSPETVDPGKPVECGGPEASDRLTELVKNRSVVLTTDPTQDRNDRFGRLLAYVDRSGTDVGREMIRAGHAAVFVFERPFQRLASYRQAEEAARTAGRGVWGSCGGNFHAPGADDAASESRSDSAERFIRRYYFLLNQRRFSTAWAKFSTNLRRRFAPYASWRAAFARTVGTRVNSVSVSLAGTRAVVRVAIRARDRDACSGRVVRQFFRVRWVLSRAAGHGRQRA